MLVVDRHETIAHAGVDPALLPPDADAREHNDIAWTDQSSGAR
ncbi:MAG: hypothetical protein RKP46_04840 [Candidatus Accumulibacter sp.]|nr:hypothetical protein [Accumulibacter sp.]MDS4013667.1 hypothetical protein [Accumulibacter sp.]